MAIRWLNNYHRGFNRLWLVLSCLVTFAFVGLNALIDEYQVSNPSKEVRYFPVPVTDEEMIKDRARELWLEGVRNKGKALIDDFFDGKQPSTIYGYVKAMPETKSFTYTELSKLINEAIEAEKNHQDWINTYPQRVWKARGRFVRDLLGSFIVTFAFGHGVFLVVYWIIKGFRKD